MSLNDYIVKKKKGEVLFCEHEPGNTMFFINAGKVRLTKVLNDKEKTLSVLARGEFLGEMSIIKSLPRTATCTIEEDAALLELDKNSFFLLVQKQPALGVNMLKIFAERIADQKRKLQIISRTTVDARILDTLLMCHETGNSKMISSDSFEIEMSMHEVADLAGLSDEECAPALEALIVSNKIKQFEKNKLVIENTEMIRSIINRTVE